MALFEPLTPEKQAIRLKANELRASGVKIKEIAEQLGVPVTSVNGWLSWGKKYLSSNTEIEQVVPNTVPLETVKPVIETAPVVEIPHNGHSNIIGEINLERRYEIENAELAVINSCPGPGQIAAIEEEEKFIISAVQARVLQTQPTHEAEVVPVEAGQPGPVLLPEKKTIAPGWYLLGGILCAVVIVVLLILGL